MTTVDVLHAGYTGERVGSTIVLVRGDGDATIVVDPGLVRTRSLILDPLTVRGVAPEAVTHVFVSHHHLDHTLNIALFPNAEVIDFESRFRDDQWLEGLAPSFAALNNEDGISPVSYTHLTLPTICSV